MWDPWAVVDERGDVMVRYADCAPMGMLHCGDPNVITLHHRLTRRERRAVLTHELVHLEEDATWTRDTPPRLIQKIEARVDRTAVDRLVPPVELDELARHAAEHDVPFSACDVVERFDVPLAVAHKAMSLWQTRPAATHGRRSTGR